MAKLNTRSCDHKIQVSVNISPRTVNLLTEEAKRVGISFSDQVRRITDDWAERLLEQRSRPKEKILVLDRERGELRGVR